MRALNRNNRLIALAAALPLAALGVAGVDLGPGWVSDGAALTVQALLLAVIVAQALYGGVVLLDPGRALAAARELPVSRSPEILATLGRRAAWLVALGTPYAVAAWALTGAAWPLAAAGAASAAQALWYRARIGATARLLDLRVDPPPADNGGEDLWPA